MSCKTATCVSRVLREISNFSKNSICDPAQKNYFKAESVSEDVAVDSSHHRVENFRPLSSQSFQEAYVNTVISKKEYSSITPPSARGVRRERAWNDLKNTRAVIFSSICLIQLAFAKWKEKLAIDVDGQVSRPKISTAVQRLFTAWVQYLRRIHTKESIFICMKALYFSKLKLLHSC